MNFSKPFAQNRDCIEASHLSKLQAFLLGYEVALSIHNIEHDRVGIWRPMSRELPFFHGWVTRKLGFGNSNLGYSQAILKYTNGDEVAALALFWELLDEYRALEAGVDGAVLPEAE